MAGVDGGGGGERADQSGAGESGQAPRALGTLGQTLFFLPYWVWVEGTWSDISTGSFWLLGGE